MRPTSKTLIHLIFLPGKAPKEIYAILKETLEKHAPNYASNKINMAQFKCDDFATVLRLVLDDPTQ
jgi:hypothetical protein